MKSFVAKVVDGTPQYPLEASEIVQALEDGLYRFTITTYSESRSERLSNFFHGPVIDAYIRYLQDNGYLKYEAKALLKHAVKKHFKEQFGPEYTYYDPLKKIQVRELKSFAKSNEPWAISQREAVEMLSQLEVEFAQAGIPWPDNETYKAMKSELSNDA